MQVIGLWQRCPEPIFIPFFRKLPVPTAGYETVQGKRKRRKNVKLYMVSVEDDYQEKTVGTNCHIMI